MTKSRKARIALMLLAFLLAAAQWYLIVGIFDYMHAGSLIPNLLEKFFGWPLVDWLVWLLYGAFEVVVPVFFWVRGGKTSPGTTAIWVAAVGFNVVNVVAWMFCQNSLAQFSSAITVMIMTTLFNTILVGVLYVLLIYKLFPDEN